MSLRTTMRRSIACALWLVAFSLGSLSYAATSIEIEVAIEPGAPITAPQQWATTLGKVGLSRVQIRSARSDDRPQVVLKPSTTGERIKVLAILNRRNELVFPKHRFKSHQLAALRTYFKELPIDAAEGDDPRGRFDLTDKQFHAIYADFESLVDFSTERMTQTELLNRLTKKFATPVEIDPIAKVLLNDSPVTMELRGMAAGTSLARSLRLQGLALQPEKPRGKPLRIRVVRYDRAIETWPVGWRSEASPRRLAPKMFESLTLEIAGYSLTQALNALKPRLGVPVVMDEWILRRKDIQPDKVQVKLKRGKTYLKKAVDRILSQARLAGELRVDELGQPFYWVTQFGEDSLRAE